MSGGWRPRVAPTRLSVTNRLLWTAAGTVLLLGGVAMTLLNRGTFGFDRTTPMVWPALVGEWHRLAGWARAAAIAAALTVVALGALLLWVELRVGRRVPMTDQVLHSAPASPPGLTWVATPVLTRALEADLRGHPQILRSDVLLTGSPGTSRAYVRLRVAADADVTQLHRHVDWALHRFANSFGWSPELAEVTVALTPRDHPRVR
jgi:hypothetical protein